MFVFFCRCARQEVLDKVQIRLSIVRRQQNVPAAVQRVADTCPGAHAAVVAVGFRVGVAAAQYLVFIRFRTRHVATGFLIQVGDGDAAVEGGAIVRCGFIQPGRFLLVVPAVSTETFFSNAVQQQCLAETAFFASAHPRVTAPGATRAVLNGQIVGGAGTRQHNVDHAVHGIGAVESTRRAAYHFDSLSVFRVGVKQFVNITEAGGTQRYALLCQQKSATGTAAAKNGRADGGQAFLAVITMQVNARQAVG